MTVLTNTARWSRRVPLLAALLLATGVLMSTALLGSSTPAHAQAAPFIKVQPASQQVNLGQAFSVEIRANAGQAMTGIQADLLFNRNLLQVTSVTVASTWSGANQVPSSLSLPTINATGQMSIAHFLSNPATINPGEHLYVTVNFQAGSNKGGQVPLVLSTDNTHLLDASGNGITALQRINGAVTILGPNVGGVASLPGITGDVASTTVATGSGSTPWMAILAGTAAFLVITFAFSSLYAYRRARVR